MSRLGERERGKLLGEVNLDGFPLARNPRAPRSESMRHVNAMPVRTCRRAPSACVALYPSWWCRPRLARRGGARQARGYLKRQRHGPWLSLARWQYVSKRST